MVWCGAIYWLLNPCGIIHYQYLNSTHVVFQLAQLSGLCQYTLQILDLIDHSFLGFKIFLEDGPPTVSSPSFILASQAPSASFVISSFFPPANMPDFYFDRMYSVSRLIHLCCPRPDVRAVSLLLSCHSIQRPYSFLAVRRSTTSASSCGNTVTKNNSPFSFASMSS
jgi:hypothetical protein